MIRYLTIKTEGSFDSAHKIPNTLTKCQNLHGHTWRVEIEITGVDSPKFRMMVDFIDIKKTIDHLDHIYLNDYFKNPTAENIARYFALKIWRIADRQYPFLLTVRARVFESPKSFAEVEANREELHIGTIPEEVSDESNRQ